MTADRSQDHVFVVLYAQAVRLWGQEDAERQRQALTQTAAELATLARFELPPDVEPRFF